MDVRPRARELGIPFRGRPGKWNAITDVAGVEVGYTTLLDPPNVCTGVTMILPRSKRGSKDPVCAGSFTLNGNGEMTGMHWVEESGFLESPIGITTTHSVGTVQSAIIKWLIANDLMFGRFCYPLVAETFDGRLNDTKGFHVREEHALAALENAKSGPVEEGNIGGGVGMALFQWKGGSGTSSRIVTIDSHDYTLGAFVQGNFGRRSEATIAGVPVGSVLGLNDTEKTAWGDASPHIAGRGSIIVVLATDAPVLPRQLNRLAKRAALGIGRTGGNGSNNSGELLCAFSTANPNVAQRKVGTTTITTLTNDSLDPLFEASADATEEAIVNALVAARTYVGIDGHRLESIPIDQLQSVLRTYNRLNDRGAV